jgi:LPS-assembly lipoprotein
MRHVPSPEGADAAAFGRRAVGVSGLLPSRRLLLRGAALATLAGLAGCGFQLRQPGALPFRRLALTGFGPGMEQALRTAIGPAVGATSALEQAEVQLLALASTRERSVASYTPTRRASQFQLRARLRYRVQTPAGKLLLPDADLVLTRSMNYSETQALGKEYEESRLYADMEADIAQQVLRRLGTVKFPP